MQVRAVACSCDAASAPHLLHKVDPGAFFDVDGSLIPIGAPSPGPAVAWDMPQEQSNPLLARLNPDYGRRLLQLSCDLVWATSWMADANDVIAPRLGLPALPVVDWPDEDQDDGLHWKTRGLIEWAAGQPFVWVDDEITHRDRAWVSAHYDTPALLHRVDPRTGLTETDFTVIERWLAQL